MSDDAELTAMARISEIFGGLSEDQTDRVIMWAADRYGTDLTGQVGSPATGSGSDPGAPHSFDTLAELFAAADPQTNADKALVGAFWIQEVEGETDGLKSAQVNKQLKHLGHQISDITSAFDRLMGRSPKHAVQMRKEGSTRQARKLYKVTHAGIAHVRTMLEDEGDDNGS